MKNILPILILILCYSCQNSKIDNKNLNMEKMNNEESNAFNQKMDSLFNTGVFNGFSVAIVDSTGTIYNEGFGYADVDKKKKYTANTIINIASISKMFIGVSLMKAKELGFVNLDDPINNYLPFEVINPNYPNELITIRQLATHTSSIVDTDAYMQSVYINKDDLPLAENLKEKYELYYQNPSQDWIPLAEYLRKLLKKDEGFYDTSTFSKNKPGDIYEYSNIGSALCALVIENATNRSFSEFTEDYIFEPLKMSSTSWFFEEVNSNNYSKLYFDDQELPYYKILSYPDGGLITSSSDLSKFLAELMKGYTDHGVILSSDSFKELFKPQLKESAFEKKQNYNVGIFTENELKYHVIGHTGGDPGTNTMMFFDTESGRGKIFITNTDSDRDYDTEIMWGIWNALDTYKKPSFTNEPITNASSK